MKRLLSFIAFTLLATATFAQSESGKSFWDDPFNDPRLPIYVTFAFMGVVIVLLVVVILYIFKVLRLLAESVRGEGSTVAQPRSSWWSRFVERLNASVPVEQEKTIELDHDYDGIRELDNHLPPWWKWLFYFTIGWAAVYLVVYHVTYTLPLSEEEYRHELALAEEQARKLKASQPESVIDENALEYTADAEIIEKGKTVYMNNNCGSCHRNDGGGNSIGPNLTDEYWLHGGDIKSVFTTIKNGVIEKGMPAWGKVMSARDVRDVAFFVLSLQGTNPPDAKAPQGERYTQPAADHSTEQALK